MMRPEMISDLDEGGQTNSNPERITIIDYYSETNRGDAAIQVKLIDLIKDQFPDSEISVCAADRINNPDYIDQNLHHTKEEGVDIFSGISPEIPQSKALTKIPLIQPIYSFFVRVVILFLILVRVPDQILSVILPQEFAKSIKQLRSSNIIIWRGGNFRIGQDPKRELFHSFNWTYHALICIALRKPIACVGISIWPLHSKISKFIFRFSLGKCFFVATRERISQKRVQELLSPDKEVHLIPDLAPSLVRESSKSNNDEPVKSNEPKEIGVTIVDKHDDDSIARSRYFNSMKNIFSHIISESDAKIIVIPQAPVPWEDNSKIKNELLAEFESTDRIVDNTEEMTIKELVEIYSRIDLLVGARLHSSVFALSVGTPTFMMRYDLGPQWDILHMMGAERYLVNYQSIDSDETFIQFRSFYEKQEYPINEILNNVDHMSSEIESEFSKIHQYR